MDFEYDPHKSRANQHKHGLSLEEAIELWRVNAVEVPAYVSDEPRFMRIGRIGEKFYSCIFTVRTNKIRLISARRSRQNEEALYHEKNKEIGPS